MSSPKAVPVVVPLLSPIPWLIARDEDMESVGSMDDPPSPSTSGSRPPHPALSPPSTRRTAPPKTSNAPLPQSATSTPTGGLVDEVDPGSGTHETASPVGLTSAGVLASEGKSEVAALRDRFVRASSPRVERGSPEDEQEKEAGEAGAEVETMVAEP